MSLNPYLALRFIRVGDSSRRRLHPLTFGLVLRIRFIPKYFDPDLSDGRPRLTEEGKRVVALELEGDGY